MYTAELFAMANDPKAVKEVFLNNVTLSIEDDAPGCIDLDAEKERKIHSSAFHPFCPCGFYKFFLIKHKKDSLVTVLPVSSLSVFTNVQ